MSGGALSDLPDRCCHARGGRRASGGKRGVHSGEEAEE